MCGLIYVNICGYVGCVSVTVITLISSLDEFCRDCHLCTAVTVGDVEPEKVDVINKCR